MPEKKTNFSKFLNSIYKFRNDTLTNRDRFIFDFFKAAGRKEPLFLESDGILRKICNGSRRLSGSLTDYFPKNPNLLSEKEYVKSVLNSSRIKEIYVEFDIADDEKEDFDSLCQAIAMQFENFMKYEDAVNTTVKSLFEILIDSQGYAAMPNANENALYAAKHMFYTALQSINQMRQARTLLESRAPIENFLQNIYQCFRAFEIRCNRVGKITYRSVRNDFIRKSPKINDYLRLVSEPGSLPLPLKKLVRIIIYDQLNFSDQVIEKEFDLDNDYTIKDIRECFKQLNLKAYEVGFSEKIFLRLDDHEDLIPDLQSLISDVKKMLEQLESNFKKDPRISKINEGIRQLISEQTFFSLSFTIDGSYFPASNKIEYATSMDGFIGVNKEGMKKPGEDLFHLDRVETFRGSTFEETLKKFATWTSFVFSKGEHGPDHVMMTELIVINRDGSYRYYMYPPTCAAKTFRVAREVAELGRNEQILAVMSAITYSISAFYPEAIKKSAKERQEIGEDMLEISAYYNNKLYKARIFLDGPQFVQPVECPITEISHSLIPIYMVIKENEKNGTEIEYYKRQALKAK
ncbi:MAG TPA: hypothetical protein PLW94_02580 [Candidatus Absconditabacterales bacterium]|nr:hypothetical protein [Candidatus Absconditabacterales bacterium]